MPVNKHYIRKDFQKTLQCSIEAILYQLKLRAILVVLLPKFNAILIQWYEGSQDTKSECVHLLLLSVNHLQVNIENIKSLSNPFERSFLEPICSISVGVIKDVIKKFLN